MIIKKKTFSLFFWISKFYILYMHPYKFIIIQKKIEEEEKKKKVLLIIYHQHSSVIIK